jgi:hypothetical protein
MKYPVPADHVNRKHEWHGRDIWRYSPEHGLYRQGTVFQARWSRWQQRILTWLRDHVHRDIPFHYYNLVLGHDVHVTVRADLFARHYHNGWANPITGEVARPLDPTFDTLFKTHYVDHQCDLFRCPRDLGITRDMLQGQRGMVENLGLLSSGKVTDIFVSEIIDELVSTTGTEFADFDFHEVGTSSQAESNNDTALITTSGIARATGAPTDVDPIYRNVATVTADATETWQEHGVFNNSTGAALMDRSLTGGQSVNSLDDVQYTYQLTVNPEA